MTFLLVIVVICYVSNVHGWVIKMENPGMFQGDIVLQPDELKALKEGTFSYSALGDSRRRWPNNKVPYVIDNSLINQPRAINAINAAIRDYHKYTCLKFVKETYPRGGYIRFVNGNGCSSPVGYYGRENRITLASGCWSKGTVIHEIGHSVGLHHEQTRPDRDNYVTVIKENIQKDAYFNFNKQQTHEINYYNTNYDYLSIMHYGYDSFAARQGLTTIRTKDPKYHYHIGQQPGFSRTDVIQLGRMFNCAPPELPTDPIIKENCYNKFGSGCIKDAEQGKCTDRGWKNHMQTNCRMACNLCGDGGTVITVKPPVTDVITAKPPVTDCKDISPNCAANTHLCRYVDYVKRNCQKTCGLCT